MIESEINKKTACAHCGDVCPSEHPFFEDHNFCCNGCEMIYKMLHEHNMQAYYVFEQTPGTSQSSKLEGTFEFLDNEEVENNLLSFKDNGISRISLKLPQIHCSSCLWLLENLHRLNPGIYSSKVNFATKEATIQFRSAELSLRQLVELLDKIGYTPELNFSLLNEDKKTFKYNKRLLYQLGLAGFSFGNIMLLSFPEYLGFEKASINFFIGYINIVLALPVLLFSGIDYIKSAFVSLQHKQLNLDFPIALGMITLFSRSIYEILSQTGEGYLDSFSGFVFFLLIGKWFQNFTHKSLDFERNYESYFPISSTIWSEGSWITRSIDQIKVGDKLLVRNKEIVPVDAILLKGNPNIDYSFVTGESDQIRKNVGDKILAGGKLFGNSVELKCLKKVNQSYLTKLWNNGVFKQEQHSDTSKFVNTVSKYFTLTILVIALATVAYWLKTNPYEAFQNFTSVLIVACPCALALSIPFTHGNILRLLSKKGFFLKNINTIETIQDIDHIVFDKTGTLTDGSELNIKYVGNDLSPDQKLKIKSLCAHSSHPLSKKIVAHLASIDCKDIISFEEYEGLGISGIVEGESVRLGSSKFIFNTEKSNSARGVFIEIDGEYIGHFVFEHSFRPGISSNISKLMDSYNLSMISGDTDDDRIRVENIFGKKAILLFNQTPQDKLNYIRNLQSKNQRVLMIGDGLNDAGALKQSNIGMVLSEQNNNFSPACDAILNADQFDKLAIFIDYIRNAKKIIYVSFGLAFLYNIIGLLFAVTGNLSPVVAAILMPLSSITIILFGVSISTIVSIKYLNEK